MWMLKFRSESMRTQRFLTVQIEATHELLVVLPWLQKHSFQYNLCLTEKNSDTSNHWFVQWIYSAFVWDDSPLVIWLCKFILGGSESFSSAQVCNPASFPVGPVVCCGRPCQRQHWDPVILRLKFCHYLHFIDCHWGPWQEQCCDGRNPDWKTSKQPFIIG